MIHRCQNIFFGNCERWLRKLRKVFMIMQHFFFFFFFPETELKKKKIRSFYTFKENNPTLSENSLSLH